MDYKEKDLQFQATCLSVSKSALRMDSEDKVRTFVHGEHSMNPEANLRDSSVPKVSMRVKTLVSTVRIFTGKLDSGKGRF